MATILSLRRQKTTFSFDFSKAGGSFFRFFQRFCFNNHLFLSKKKRGGLFSCPEHSFLQSEPPVLLDAGKKVVILCRKAVFLLEMNHLFSLNKKKGGVFPPKG
ncbi:MAG: hypothetical protein Q4C07_05570 [Eubacteriales bacterium]|nr:hypothetical protein [Eubacteriales bacterium]